MNEQPVNRQHGIYKHLQLLGLSPAVGLRSSLVGAHLQAIMDSTQSFEHLLASPARNVVSTAPHSGRIPMTCGDEKLP
jgi:hypothetical protein